MTAALRLEGIACLRGGRLLFEGLDLALAPGEAALVAGPNGIGKSSLIRIVAGLLAPAAGRVVRHGGMALSAEGAALDERLPLGRALAFWTRLDGAADAAGAAAAFGLAALAEVPVRMLSTGQRKRASLARVAASGAAIWLLDEPANGLDADGLARLETALRDHRRRGGIAVVASHSPIDLPAARAVTL